MFKAKERIIEGILVAGDGLVSSNEMEDEGGR